MKVKDFEQLPHTADVKIEVYGSDLPELFAHAVKGMFHLMQPKATDCVYEKDRLACKKLSAKREFNINSPDINMLLVDFLSYALYLFDVYHEIYLDAQFDTFDQTHCTGTLSGTPISGLDAPEIKAVTYHELNIIKKNGIWQTIIVFDI